MSVEKIGEVGGDKFSIKDLVNVTLGDMETVFYNSLKEMVEKI